jgi:hypothetical protein
MPSRSTRASAIFLLQSAIILAPGLWLYARARGLGTPVSSAGDRTEEAPPEGSP